MINKLLFSTVTDSTENYKNAINLAKCVQITTNCVLFTVYTWDYKIDIAIIASRSVLYISQHFLTKYEQA